MPTRVSTEFVEHYDILSGSGRVSSEFVEHYDILSGSGRVSSEFVEHYDVFSGVGRVTTHFIETFLNFNPATAIVPNITGTVGLPATFDGSGSTGSINLYRWEWTSVPLGSTIANLAPQPFPDNGGTNYIAMTNNQALYHGDYIDPTPYPDNQAVSPINMTNNVGLYHFNGNFLDSSGSNYHGKHNQPTSAAGKIGSLAMEFDGNDRVEFGNVFDFPTGNFSVSFWIYPAATQNNTAVVMSRYITPSNGWTIEQNVGTLNSYRFGMALSGTATNTVGTTALTANVWSHLCIVRVGTNVKIYVNGVLNVNSTNAAFANIGSQLSTFTMGNHSSQLGAAQWWRGRLDEVAIWSREITAVEVANIYSTQNGGTPFPDNGDITGWISMANNEGLYHFNGDFLDASGNSRNGLLYGPFPVTGKVGAGAYIFDRSFGSIETTSNFNFKTSDFSISFWANPSSIQVDSSAIMSNRSTIIINGWFIAQSGVLTNQFRLGTYNEGVLTTTTLVTLTANVWQHLCYVRTGSNIRTYLNGSLVANDTIAGFATIGVSRNLLTFGALPATTMGTSGFSNTNQFNGSLDEIAIWSRALSAGDVSTIYTTQNGGTPFPDNGSISGWISMANNEGLYHLDSNFLDSSGNSRHGSSNGLAFGAKLVGTHGVVFSGFSAIQVNNSFIELGNSFNFTTGNFTVAFWVFPEISQALSAPIISNLKSGPAEGWTIEQFTTNANRYYFGVRNAGVTTFTTATPQLLDNTWSHLCVVRTGNNIKIYVNGLLSTDTTNAAFATIGTTTNFLNVGAHPLSFGGTVYWRGRLDELAIWSRSLSPSEILNIYKVQSGNIMLDTSGNDNTAKLTWVDATEPKLGPSSLDFNRIYSAMEMRTPISVSAGIYTIAFWFFNLKSNTAIRRIGARASTNPGYIAIGINSGGNQLGVFDNSGTFIYSGFDMAAASYTGWHHICVVADGLVSRFYINGQYKGQSNSVSTQDISSIGNINPSISSNQLWADRLDEVAIWTRALDATEVFSLHTFQSAAYAGFGPTFTFTPDLAGTYTVQLSVTNVSSYQTSSVSANAIITAAGGVPELLQGSLFRYRYSHQGFALRKKI